MDWMGISRCGVPGRMTMSERLFKRLIIPILIVAGLMLSLSACPASSPVGCTGTVDGKCVSTGTKPPAMY